MGGRDRTAPQRFKGCLAWHTVAEKQETLSQEERQVPAPEDVL